MPQWFRATESLHLLWSLEVSTAAGWVHSVPHSCQLTPVSRIPNPKLPPTIQGCEQPEVKRKKLMLQEEGVVVKGHKVRMAGCFKISAAAASFREHCVHVTEVRVGLVYIYL